MSQSTMAKAEHGIWPIGRNVSLAAKAAEWHKDALLTAPPPTWWWCELGGAGPKRVPCDLCFHPSDLEINRQYRQISVRRTAT